MVENNIEKSLLKSSSSVYFAFRRVRQGLITLESSYPDYFAFTRFNATIEQLLLNRFKSVKDERLLLFKFVVYMHLLVQILIIELISYQNIPI